MRTSIFRLFSILVFCFATQGFAQNGEHVDGPIHEAFVSPSQGAVILEAIAEAPPERITEKIPPSPGNIEEWIPGYWAWSKTKGDFVWVCGVWRKPPPGMIWNPGYWKNFDEGWVWIKGFWHSQPAQTLRFIAKNPPATINENKGNPPSNNMFWAPGYWEFQSSRNSYQWRGGSWEKMDPKWVFTPASYTWRPEGYAFIPAYWDWPIADRGSAYCTIFLEPNQRSGIVHTPTVILQPEVIMRTLFCCWPDYILFFHHCWIFCPGFWGGWCCIPPWWGWGGWWWFDWFFAWDLWWWWGHPGFPFPFWLAAAMAGMIPPPGAGIFPLMANVPPPPFIGPNGMLPPDDLIDAIGGDRPILPADPQEREDIIDSVKPPESESGDLRPNGTPSGPEPEVPEVDQGDVDQGPTQTVPPIPETPSFQPPIQTVPTPPSYQPTTPRPFAPRPIRPIPKIEPPVQTPRPFPTPQPEYRRPRWPRPEFRPPRQTPRFPIPEYVPPSETAPPTQTPSTPPTQTPSTPPSSWTPPTQIRPEFQPQRVRPMFQPQRIRPEFTPPPQSAPPQTAPPSSTELY